MVSTSFQVLLTLTSIPHAEKIAVNVDSNDSSMTLVEKCATASKIPFTSIRVIFRGRMMDKKDETKKAIEEYKLTENCVLHCMGKPVEEVAPAASTAASTTETTTTTVPPVASMPTSTTPTTPLDKAIQTLESSNPKATFQTAITTLDKILSNIVQNPMEEKYRKLKRQNAAFQKRLGGLRGGHDAMLAVGFVVETTNQDGGDAVESYVLHPNPEAWPQVLHAKTRVAQALAAQQQQQPQQQANPLLGMGSPGMGLPPALSSQMERMATQMMSNPQQLQSMLNNPMVQQMMQNDPRMRNNPLLQQQMQQLANNPQALQYVSQMMQQNPSMLQSMMSQMNRGGGFGAGLPTGFGAPAASAPNLGAASASAPSGSAPAQNQASDQEMTEEEMIQEAIRRSLGEQ